MRSPLAYVEGGPVQTRLGAADGELGQSSSEYRDGSPVTRSSARTSFVPGRKRALRRNVPSAASRSAIGRASTALTVRIPLNDLPPVKNAYRPRISFASRVTSAISWKRDSPGVSPALVPSSLKRYTRRIPPSPESTPETTCAARFQPSGKNRAASSRFRSRISLLVKRKRRTAVYSGGGSAPPPLMLGDRDANSRPPPSSRHRSEEHTSELQSRGHLVCRLLLEKKKNPKIPYNTTKKKKNKKKK